MKGYCVIGIGENRGMEIQCCSDNLVGSKQLKEIREKILDIHLPKGQQTAICVYTLPSRNIVLSKITRIESSEFESRPHTLQHQYIMSFQEYLNLVKTKMDYDKLKQSFFYGPLSEVDSYKADGKLEFPEELHEKSTLQLLKGFYPEEKWNLFCNLIFARQKNLKLAVLLNESINRDLLTADIYRLLPNDYAVNTSILTAGNCSQTMFHLRLVSETGEEDLRKYKCVSLNQLLRTKSEKQEYPNLKKIVLAPNKIRDEFYASKYMNRYSEYDRLMSFSSMERAAQMFLKDKKMKIEQDRSEKRFEQLLKEILVWRNNEVKMGHTASLLQLDEILKKAGAIPFHTKEKMMYDPGKHEVVSISPTENPEESGKIAESFMQGYLFEEKVLLKEDVVVYRGGGQHD